ncbi:MAG: hypothetical protein VB083_01975 [Aminobacterium sp.]|uniref:hypothetical protein n=1 Tax=Aminobacterium sp. TaxID=1872491 RepID=UPI002B1FB331|nr:hypothetical protein [Aminobacterium sp.]MEA4876655.1 hypothetical protein [Aminobacterium sp.]
MINVIRKGAPLLILKGAKEAIVEWLQNNFEAEIISLEGKSFEETLGSVEQGQAGLIVKNMNESDEIPPVVLVTTSHPDKILERIINEKATTMIEYAERLPRVIFFRVFGDYRTVLKEIQNDFGGRLDKIGSNLVFASENPGVPVCFTEKSLKKGLAFQRGDLLEEGLFIDMPFEELFKRLNSSALHYFNAGLNNRDWNVMEVRLYDADKQYWLHTRRLRLALEGLEVCMVIGEGWGKDYAHILMPVPVYCIRILTFLEPFMVKRALMGLEYTEDGQRFVDLDLYHNRKKISWGDVPGGEIVPRSERERPRTTLSMAFRKEVMAALDERECAEIQDIEEAILEKIPQRDDD